MEPRPRRADVDRTFGHGGATCVVVPGRSDRRPGRVPSDLPAAVLVVVHLAKRGGPSLVALLERNTSWRVVLTADQLPLERGVVYVAPGDRHLMVRGAAVRVVRGPRENGARPAVDPLLRSLARVSGASVGVVLSGALGDGASGLAAMRAAHCFTIVQAPDEALVASMPEHALLAEPDHLVLPAAEIAASIAAHIGTRPANRPPPSAPGAVPPLELRHLDDLPTTEPVPWACPDCGGVLHHVEDPAVLRFRCRVGHAWSAEDLHATLDLQVEDALWLALHTLEDQIELDERLLERARRSGRDRAAALLQQRIVERRNAVRPLWRAVTE